MADVMVWEQIGADGKARALDGRTKFGRTNWESSPANLVRQAYEESLDGAWYLKRAAQLMGPGPDGQLRVYISGPYSDDDPEQVDANIEQARQAAGAILTRGHYPFCPHTMTAHFDETFPHISWHEYIATDLAFLPFCHVLLQLPRWEDSNGSLIELEDAERLSLLVIEDVEELPNLTARRLARGGLVMGKVSDAERASAELYYGDAGRKLLRQALAQASGRVPGG